MTNDPPPTPASLNSPAGLPAAPDSGPFAIVGIGASAGGLEAYQELFRHLPLHTGLGFVLVSHLDPDH